MLVAVKYLRPVGLGVTSPQLFRASDGQIYVVKLQNNRLGPKVLANELLGARFGELLGLCFPPSSIIELDEQVLNSSRRLKMAGVGPGLHFASQCLSDVRYLSPDNLSKAVNRKEMAGVMLFDHLFHNLDRTLNRRNLLLRREADGYRIYAIDNSHLFRRGRWTQESLAKLGPEIKINRYRCYGTLLKHFFQPDWFDEYVTKINKLSDQYLHQLIAEIPWEWLPHAGDRQALERFLITRRDMTTEIAGCLAAQIPNKKRSADMPANNV